MVSSINILFVDGTPHIPSEISNMDVTNAREKETVNIEFFYSTNFKVSSRPEIYYSSNELIMQFARDCAANQTLQFVYTFENGKWLFISSKELLINFKV